MRRALVLVVAMTVGCANKNGPVEDDQSLLAPGRTVVLLAEPGKDYVCLSHLRPRPIFVRNRTRATVMDDLPSESGATPTDRMVLVRIEGKDMVDRRERTKDEAALLQRKFIRPAD